MALNKTPGIDGLPVEFYIENWEILSDILLELYNAILHTGSLGESQRKGLVTLIPKSENVMYIENYRPISLLCIDYKVLAKLLAERMKSILCKVVNNKQFCGIPDRSINQCNIDIRDIIH